MRNTLLIALFLFSQSVLADVLDVGIWKSLPGMGPETAKNAAAAKAIHEKLGAQVGIAYDTMGRLHYAMTFPNWTEWAKFGTKLNKSKAWAKWQERAIANPAAELEDQYLLNEASAGSADAVYQVYIWEANGSVADLVGSGMEAEPLHEQAGARVGIYVDQLNRMHYVVGFDSWEAWGKFQDTPNEAFAKWWAERSSKPAGKLVKVYTAGE